MPSSRAALTALLGIKNLSVDQIKTIIDVAIELKGEKLKPHIDDTNKTFQNGRVPNVALLFFEPSTRTRFSFEIAIKNLKLNSIVYVADAFTSQVKGESNHETLNTLIQMRPDMLIVRHAGDEKVNAILRSTHVPVINAGDGKDEHPTQALLDAMTIQEKLGQIEGQKILFVGDVEHSRVAHSDQLLFNKMGAEVAVCAPSEFLPKTKSWQGVRTFSDISDAVSWATVCMGLRVQKERHAGRVSFSENEYSNKYKLSRKNLANLGEGALIMHPGPFVSGVDLDEDILTDPRCVIHRQVENGVYIRMAVIGEIFGLFGT